MKKFFVALILVALIVVCGLYAKRRFYDPGHRLARVERLVRNGDFRDGDIIFHASLSGQSRAIQLATGSEYSHCGIIYRTPNGWQVYEAVQPVKLTPLEKWISRGKECKFVVKRLREADRILTPEVLQKMQVAGKQFIGKDYDLAFEWSDDKIYCSELVWKIYHRATGLELGQLQKLSDFDLSSAPVKEKLRERYGDNIPADEPVISPVAIFDCPLLETVIVNS